MNCKDLQNLFGEFVDGTLEAADSKLVRNHVASCAACGTQLSAYRSLVSLLDDVEKEPVPAGFADSVIAKLKAAGQIVEPSPALAPAFGWLARIRPAMRLPLAFAAFFVVALSLFPAVLRPLLGSLGRLAVVAGDALVVAQAWFSSIEILHRLALAFETNLRTMKTIVNAVFSLLATAGEAYMVPAIAMVIVLTVGFAWFFRSAHRRSAHNASFFA